MPGPSQRARRKASGSNPNGNCLFVGIRGGRVVPAAVELTNDNERFPSHFRGPLLATPAEWRAFIDAVKRGEFDLDEHDLLPPVADPESESRAGRQRRPPGAPDLARPQYSPDASPALSMIYRQHPPPEDDGQGGVARPGHMPFDD